MNIVDKIVPVTLFALFIITGCNPADKNRSWSIYKADNESSSYSPLTTIDTRNVKQLKPAWTFAFQDATDTSHFGRSECNPIIIDNVMYVTSARHRVYAVDAGTGRQIWSFDPFNGERGGGVSRGVTYWEDGGDKRILFTAGDNLYAVDAQTGVPIGEFGQQGKVSMNFGFRGDPATISVIPTSPGIVYGDLLIMGTEVSELYGAEPGYIQAYYIKTGKHAWTFHTIPLPGEPGYETWPADAWKYAGGVNAWAGLSLDKKRGLVFLALGSPSYDFYGGDRKGQNLYGNCVMALDAKTGKYKWHFQTIRHDLWDYDLPAPPNLVTVTRDGQKVDAVAQVSKIGFVYVLDRETGKSLFPVEERKVPASNVPGEHAWPTQPFPLKPAPFARQLLKEDDLADFTPGAHDSLVKIVRSLRYEGLFTPPDLRGSLNFPGTRGGAEWGGAAYDPTGVLFIRSNDSPEIDSLQLVKHDPGRENQPASVRGKAFYTNHCKSCHGADRQGDGLNNPSLLGIQHRITTEAALTKIRRGGGRMPAFASILHGSEDAIIAYLFDIRDRHVSDKETNLLEISRNMTTHKKKVDKSQSDSFSTYLNLTAYSIFKGPDGHPAIKPPFGTLSALNLHTGNYVWKIPIGNHAELQKKGEPPTGSVGSAGPIVTAGGLIFISGTSDKKLLALDKLTGKTLWEFTLPAPGTATPSTYFSNRKQYVAISVAGNRENPGGYLMAFSLGD
ncbi:MAG: PQQ-binding-like beta-propeller repeat protein [Chitinophagaceae bacterium]